MREPVRILHVDDDPLFLEVLSNALASDDDRYIVETASSATDGLDYLAETDTDCIVSEYGIAGMNGLEFLKTVRRDRPDLPFILCTATGSEAVASEAISAGVTDYLRKQSVTEQPERLTRHVRTAVTQRSTDRIDHGERLLIERGLDALEDLVYIIEPDGTLLLWNERVSELIDSPDDRIGDVNVATCFPDDQRDRISDAIEEVLSTGEATVEADVLGQDGERIPHEFTGRQLTDSAGNLHGLVGIGRDLTDQKQREQTLERQTEQLAEMTARLDRQYCYLFEQAPVMAVITRSRNGIPVIEDCNRLFAETVGYEKETIIGRELAEFYSPKSTAALLADSGYEKALVGDFTREDRELVTAEGEIVETLLRAVPREHEPDEIGTLALYIDISERERLRREKERLADFTDIVAHDVRNPLTVAQGHLELAREECDSDHLETVAQAQARINTLLTDLLTLARSGQPIAETEAVDLAAAVETCWENVETSAGTVAIETSRTICADRSRLFQLLENLIRNAVDHAGDRVAVTVGALDDGTGFYVADDGPGIPVDDRERVFGHGYSTGDEGTGLGLAIVEEIAEAHGWTVQVTDSVAGGARFEITDVIMEG